MFEIPNDKIQNPKQAQIPNIKNIHLNFVIRHLPARRQAGLSFGF